MARRSSRVSTLPTLVGPPDRLGLGPRDSASFRLSRLRHSSASVSWRASRHTTVNIVLQAAWAQLLIWLTGTARRRLRHDGLGAGRPTCPALDSMVGLFINTVPVRATVDPSTTTEGLLAAAAGCPTIDTLEHHHVALADIHRITGHDQLFDTLFVYENYPVDARHARGRDVVITDIASRERTHYPLVMQASPGDELGISLDYRCDLFGPETIEALADRLQPILAAMSGRSGSDGCRRWTSSMPLSAGRWTAGETERADSPRAQRRCRFRSAFAAQVARTPDADAVTFGGSSMTYREFDDRIESVGAPADPSRREARFIGGAAVFAVPRGDRGDGRRAEDRRRLHADRSRRCRRRGSRHARRCDARCGDHHR